MNKLWYDEYDPDPEDEPYNHEGDFDNDEFDCYTEDYIKRMNKKRRKEKPKKTFEENEKILANEEIFNKIKIYKELSSEIKEKNKLLDNFKNEILNYMNDKNCLKDKQNNILAHKRISNTSRIDTNIIKNNYPDVYKNAQKTSTVISLIVK